MNPTPSGALEQQNEAISRWQSCLRQNSGMPTSTSITDARHELENRCEGHRRDVLMSFPATVEPELNQLLREQTLRSLVPSSVGTAIQSAH